MTDKTNPGNYFEDFSIGQIIKHAVPRSVSAGDRALYGALYPTRFALYSSDAFARDCGFAQSPMEDLIAFHIVFGKTVPDISLNAVANLGYAEGRWHQHIYPGDTLRTESEVIGLKENSSGKTGIVYVRSRGLKEDGTLVLDYVRWVMVRKRDLNHPAPAPVMPDLAAAVAPQDLIIPQDYAPKRYDFALAGAPHVWEDYQVGEVIDHVDGVTVEEAEHMMATRLWQNTAKVHFDRTARPDHKRLIYGGHVISMARALSFNGLANAQMVAALNAGAHANPCFSGDTIWAWSEILDKAPTAHPALGALRVRLVAHKGAKPGERMDDKGKYLPEILLDLDLWLLIPTAQAH